MFPFCRLSTIYLQEAMQAFKAGCLLSATVMLGVAAEHTFLLTLEAAECRAVSLATYPFRFGRSPLAARPFVPMSRLRVK